MYEAAYHGVPIVGFPLWGDHPDNARQVTRAGMGLWLDINNVTEVELQKTISRLLTETRYVCLLPRPGSDADLFTSRKNYLGLIKYVKCSAS